MKDKICEICKHFKQENNFYQCSPNYTESWDGRCTLNPPQYNGSFFRQPTVEFGGYCGQWEKGDVKEEIPMSKRL